MIGIPVRSGVGALVLAACASAQATLVVGPGGFAQIDAAIAAAAPGDFVQVAAGSYLPFTCNKAVTIAAVPGAAVQVLPAFSTAVVPTVFQVPAGSSARVRGLSFDSQQFREQTTRVLAGTVAFESCTFTGSLAAREVMLVQGAKVWLRDCLLSGVLNVALCSALRVLDGAVAAVDCSFLGAPLTGKGFLGAGDGITATGSSLHLVRCTAVGGRTFLFSCFYPSGAGVRTDRGDLTWIADSTLTGGDSFCNQGGDGLVCTGALPVRIVRTNLVPGVGTTAGNPSVGPVITDPQLIGLAAATQPLVRGAAYRVDWQTVPNGVLVVFFSAELQAVAPVLTQETTWLPPVGAQWLATLVADGAGLAPLLATVPNTPALQDVGVWLHAGNPFAAPWRVGPPVGGMLR